MLLEDSVLIALNSTSDRSFGSHSPQLKYQKIPPPTPIARPAETAVTVPDNHKLFGLDQITSHNSQVLNYFLSKLNTKSYSNKMTKHISYGNNSNLA